MMHGQQNFKLQIFQFRDLALLASAGHIRLWKLLLGPLDGANLCPHRSSYGNSEVL